MTDAGSYIHWGVVQISVANLLVIVVMLLVFIAAIILRMPGGHHRSPDVPPEASHDDT